MDDYYRNKKIFDNFKKMAKENYQNTSHEKLEKIVYKIMQTSMIGGLAKFEKNFGYLWGHGLDRDDLSDKERKFRDVWEDLRNEYLTYCNDNIRNMLEELNRFDVSFKKYHMDFIVRKPNGERNE